MNLIRECPFCAEFEARIPNPLAKFGVDTRVLCESEYWVCVPTVGCFVVGYVLLVSKVHVASTMQMPLRAWQELDKFVELAKDVLAKMTGRPCVVFEHGVADARATGSNSVDHAHFHIVPVDSAEGAWDCVETDLGEEIWSIGRPVYDSVSSALLANKFAGGAPPKAYYVFEHDGRWNYFERSIPYPSQFLRRSLARYCAIEKEWDWRCHANLTNALLTADMFRNCMSHYDKARFAPVNRPLLV